MTSTCRAAAALALATLFGACANGAKSAPPSGSGGSGNNSSGGSTGNNSGGTNGTTPPKGSCDNPQLDILFSPMYSAFDGVHPFKLPAIVDSMNATGVVWSAEDPSLVDMAPDPTTGGVMMTMRKAGVTKIIATAGGLCGVSSLTIAQSSPDDWMVGSARYNDGVLLDPTQLRNRRSDAGAAERLFACTNCHGDTATNGAFKTVSHTPTQTGGFSDAELIEIFMHGMVPTGGYFDEKIVNYGAWSNFHHWDMTPEQAKGVVVYLRSLTPQSQMGMRGDFGGRNGDGGRNRGDGGFLERFAQR
ncbi:MAG TPA: hypothetical protein VN914_05875 [Polyangia bacterium]|nr:hypothetical protein [Polyangia bacterium]